jgi:hypothetical protein
VQMSSRHHTRISACAPLTVCCLAAAPLAFVAAPVGVTGPFEATVPFEFVNLPTRAPSGSGHSHLFTVSDRNDSTADQVVAPQIQVERPDAGPFLTTADIAVKRRDADGSCAAAHAPALASPAPWGSARLHASTAGQGTSTVKYCSQTL